VTQLATILMDILRESVHLWTTMAPYILLGMLMAGVLHLLMDTSFISRHLGGQGFGAVIRASLWGVPLPVCSCSVIPLAATLNKQGAGKGATLSFLVSTPTTGVDSILATYALMGPILAVFRPVAALLAGVVVGGLYLLTHRSGSVGLNDSKATVPAPERRTLGAAFRYGFIELASDIGVWLMLGVFIGGVLTVIIPQSLILKALPFPALHYGVMLLLGLPLYVCATGSIPIAAALMAKGFSPGSALVFLIAGPATNTITLAFVRSKLGKHAFYAYLAGIAGVALGTGWLFDAFFANGLSSGIGASAEELMPHWFEIVCGIALLILMMNKYRPRRADIPRTAAQVWRVKGMDCGHCQVSVTQALSHAPDIGKLHFDLDRQTLTLDGAPDPDQVRECIQKAGFQTERIQ